MEIGTEFDGNKKNKAKDFTFSLFKRKNGNSGGSNTFSIKVRERRNTFSSHPSVSPLEKSLKSITSTPGLQQAKWKPQQTIGGGYLGNFQAEIVHKILFCLNPRDLSQLRVTCKFWKDWTDNFDLGWKIFLEDFNRPPSLLATLKEQTRYSWRDIYVQHCLQSSQIF